MTDSSARVFQREVAESQCVWTVRDPGGEPLSRGRVCVRAQPFWSRRERAQACIGHTPEYAFADPVEIPWPEFRDRILPELRAAGVQVGVNWDGLDGTGLNLAPEAVLQGIEAQIGLFEPTAPVVRRYVRDARWGALAGAGIALAGLGSAASISLKAALWLLLTGPIAGAFLAVELRARTAWESRGPAWSLARYVLAFASTALAVYSVGSWWAYRWSLVACMLATGFAAFAGVLLWIGTHAGTHHYRNHLHPVRGRQHKRRRRRR